MTVSAGGAALAAGARAPALGPRQDGPRVAGAFLPLALDGQAMEGLPRPPTLEPSPVPSETPTPEPTATDEPTPTATVFVCPPLAGRVQVRAIDMTPREVQVSGNRRWRGTFPVYLAPLPNGGARIGWADNEGGVRVTTVDAADQRVGKDMVLTGDEVRGLVAHPDGGVALMVVKGFVLSLVKLDRNGEQVFKKDLVGLRPQTEVDSKWVDDWGHEARLVWADNQYALYSGNTQFFGSRGKHQGDLRWHFDANGNKIEGGWDWGCSHSLDLRLAWNGNRFGPVCLSDSYPTKGIHFNHREKEIRSEPSGDGGGNSDARLGGWVPLPDGFLLSFASPAGRSSTDVGLVKVGNNASLGPVRWLTNSGGVTEDAPHLARYGRDTFLASWMADGQHLLAVVDEQGTILDGPVGTEARIAAGDDFQTMPDGDVAWAAGWGDLRQLKVVRVDACHAPVATTPPTPVATPTSSEPTRPPTAGPSPTPTVAPTAGPRACRNVLANGDFEAGLSGWSFEGETSAAFSDRSGGRFGVELLGRNDVTADLRQAVTLPADSASAHLLYWWRMTSGEAATSTKAYDILTVAADGSTAPPGALEAVSNLAGRDGWRPSAYRLPLEGVDEVRFHAISNRRDPTTFLIDDVQLIVCTGDAAEYPVLAVDPASGPASTVFQGSGTGFMPGEYVAHWALEPGSLLRFDLGSPAAGLDGRLATELRVRDTAGAWRWSAMGAVAQLPGQAGFTVTAAAR